MGRVGVVASEMAVRCPAGARLRSSLNRFQSRYRPDAQGSDPLGVMRFSALVA